MELVQSLEKTVSQWYANLPHLPANARKWLGENVWWLVLIGVVISVFGIFALVGALFAAVGLSSYVASSVYSAQYMTPSWGLLWLVTLIAFVSLSLRRS